MNDIIAMHRADLVNAVTEAVLPFKARIDDLEAELTATKALWREANATVAKLESDMRCRKLSEAASIADQAYVELTPIDDKRGSAVETSAPKCTCQWIPPLPIHDEGCPLRTTAETNGESCSDARPQGQEDPVERTHPKATDQVGTVRVSGADKQPISPTTLNRGVAK
jgi:hypothetical protein